MAKSGWSKIKASDIIIEFRLGPHKWRRKYRCIPWPICDYCDVVLLGPVAQKTARKLCKS